jgi:hypothetical protein
MLEPVAERLVFIGHGDFSWDYPFNTYYQKRRAEYIYDPSQLGPEGYIKTLKIFVAELPQLTLNNCTIRMKHTTQNEYDAPPQWTSSGWETVFSGAYTVGTLGPVSFTLSKPFHYDGVSNLIIDFSFSNPGWEDSGYFWSSFSDTYSMIYHSRDDDVYGEPLTWSGASPLPVRDDNPPSYAGSYLDLELEFFTEQGNAMPWIPLLLMGD